MSVADVELTLQLPMSERGQALLAIAESQWFDRKSARVVPRDLADSLIAMANADGGIIVIGLWDGRIEGISRDRSHQISAWQQTAFDFTTPVVPCRTRLVDCADSTGVVRQLVVFDVESSQFVHSNRKDEVFLRVGDESRRLSFVQRQELLYDKRQSSYESTVVPEVELSDLNPDLLRAYAIAVGHPDPLRLLNARGLTTKTGGITVAATLLFADSPQRWFPQASVRILRYRGVERGTGARQQLIHDRRIDGPLSAQISTARSEISELVPVRRALTGSGRFDQVGIIPPDAWLEALVNAVVHRSYSSSGDHIRVEIFDDRIEIESPGRFPGLADSANPLAVVRFARNARIARACAELSFGQELGEGIRRMVDEMRIAGLAEPEFVETSGSVRVTLSSRQVDSDLEARLAPATRDILRLLRQNATMSTGDLVEVTGRSRPGVLKQLNALRDAGLIRRVGQSAKDPHAQWVLV